MYFCKVKQCCFIDKQLNIRNMKRLIFSIVLAIVLLITFSQKANASHVSGGEVTYKSMGGMQYKIILTLYWDCAAFNPGLGASMQTTNNGGFVDQFFTVNLDSTVEISEYCVSSMANTICNGGTLPGNKKNVYSAIITLPGACSNWTFYHLSCCRNISVNSPISDSYAFYATLNNLSAPLHNSPYFTSQPMPTLCVGQTFCYNLGAVETDGYTLSFALNDAMGSSTTTPITYAAGYSGAVPMPGITIDTINGIIQFTPTMIGNFVVVYRVTERDAFGQVVGTVIRDVQMIVSNCTNQIIVCGSGFITSVTGFGATLIQPNTVQVCENVPFTFQFGFSDPDPGDTLTISSNINAVMPGSTITVTGINPITVTVYWTAPAGTSNTFNTFAVNVTDNKCLVSGQQTENYIVNILPDTYAGPDLTICGNQTASLHGYGPGNIFNWSVISGSPIVTSGPGMNFSCDTCAISVASPAISTTYLLTSSGSTGCTLLDTVTVNVVPNFTYNVTQSTTTTCLLNSVQFDVTNVNPGPPSYLYHWTPVAFLNNATIPNPIANINTPGNHTFTLTVTSPSGCVHSSNATVAVAPAVSPQITATADTSFCQGGVAALNVNFSNISIPPSCGVSMTGGCSGNANVGTVGTGLQSNNTATYPSPFGNWYTTVVQQYLYTAAELNAAGIVGGKIDQIDWNVTGIPSGAITIYHEFTIKIGCTNLTTFTSGTPFYVSGMPVVFPANTVSAVIGWNTFAFTNAYEWDGISNVIIEVCFSELNPGSNYTYNLLSQQTPTINTSSQWWYSDNQDQCGGATGLSGTANIHPDMRVHYCSIIQNPADYSYLWTSVSSGGNIANDTAQFTTGQPIMNTDYLVRVTNIAYGCSASDTVIVTLTSPQVTIISSVSTICSANPVIFTATSANAGTSQNYQWLVNGLPVGTDSIIFTSSLLSDGDVVSCVMTPSGAFCNGIDTSNFITVHVGAPNTGPAIYQNVCDSIVLFGQNYTTSGVYALTFTNFLGCDSLVTLNLIISSLDTSVSVISNQLTANQSGATYQWLNCTTGYSIINGATNQTFTATTNGNYAVIITNGSCSDTSVCFTINSIGIAEYAGDRGIQIYPNPATNQLTVINENSLVKEITITNILGEYIYKSEIRNQKSEINISALDIGMYFVTLKDAYSRILRTEKLIKE